MKEQIKRLGAIWLMLLLLIMPSSSIVLAAEGELSSPEAVVEQPVEPTTPSEEPSTPADPTPPTEPNVSVPAPQAPATPTGPITPTGPQQPTGPTEPTGKIPDYAFNDATSKWQPTDQSSFSWSASLGRYTSPLYWYDTQVGWYHVVQSPPKLATTQSAAVKPAADARSAALASLLGVDVPGAANTNTGPGSNNSALENTSTQALLQLLGNALLQNSNSATAASGDASVAGNTTGGDASTGDATVVQNFINLLQAMWSWGSGGLAYYMQNLFGDHYGDITLQPEEVTGGGGQLGALAGNSSASNSNTGAGSSNQAQVNSDSGVTVVNNPTGNIVNNLDLSAVSGNADVTGNTNGGSASTGDATVQLNLINLINSAILSGGSFFGLINIFGSLDGDILFPEGFLDAALAQEQSDGSQSASNSNTGSSSSNTATLESNSNTNLINNPSASFSNNLNTAADTGDATVTNNTSAGGAQSGESKISNSLFNLFGANVFGENAVLVLVNVMGRWVGGIMNLPGSGDSSGALMTGDATVSNNGTGPNSQNQAGVNQNSNTNIINTPTGTITNNINATAASGNASVSGNTSAGGASSGNATVAANIANIFGSQLNLRKWFGVLVINVFGDWNGSVGKDTAAGSGAGMQSGQDSTGFIAGMKAVSQQLLGTVGSPYYSANASSAQGGLAAPIESDGMMVAASQATPTSVMVAAAQLPKLTQGAKGAAQVTGLLILGAAIAFMVAAAGLALERRFSQR